MWASLLSLLQIPSMELALSFSLKIQEGKQSWIIFYQEQTSDQAKSGS